MATADRSERALSFGSVARDYDRWRPAPLADAVRWCLPDRADGPPTVLDLAAGTGLLTRVLLDLGARVVAVEPDDAMRAVLTERSPQVTALAGVGEDVPLPDASVDAVLVSSAWHWMDPERAVPEVARVLRDGGRFAALWSGPDAGVDWVGRLREPDSSSGPGAEGDRRHREVDLPAGSPFAPAQAREVTGSVRTAVQDVVGLLTTYSQVITGAEAGRTALTRRASAVLAERFPGAADVDLPLRAHCWRADRLPRLPAPSPER